MKSSPRLGRTHARRLMLMPVLTRIVNNLQFVVADWFDGVDQVVDVDGGRVRRHRKRHVVLAASLAASKARRFQRVHRHQRVATSGGIEAAHLNVI